MSLLFLLLLTPIVCYGQHYEHGNFKTSSILDDKLEGISKTLFYAALNSSKVYQTSRLLKEADSAHYSRVVKNEEVRIWVENFGLNNVEFPVKDTIVSKPFVLESVTTFAISSIDGKILSLAPLRYYEDTKRRKPMYWIEWEEARRSISLSDEKLITALVAQRNSGELTKKYLDKNVHYYDSTKNELRDILNIAFKELYSNNFDSLKPLIYNDSLFHEPLDGLLLEKLDSMNYYEIGKEFKPINFDEPILLRDTIYELDFNIRPNYIEFGEIQRYQVLNEDRSVSGWKSVGLLYSRKEDFLPLLPEWLCLLYEE